jgi:hypothetical protein
VEPAEAATLLSAADAALYKPLWMERIARAIRVPWQKITLRRPRQRWRRRREQRALGGDSGTDDRGRGA